MVSVLLRLMILPEYLHPLFPIGQVGVPDFLGHGQHLDRIVAGDGHHHFSLVVVSELVHFGSGDDKTVDTLAGHGLDDIDTAQMFHVDLLGAYVEAHLFDACLAKSGHSQLVDIVDILLLAGLVQVIDADLALDAPHQHEPDLTVYGEAGDPVGQDDLVQSVEGVLALQDVDGGLAVRQEQSLVLLVDVLLSDLLGVVLLFHLVVVLEVAVLVQLPEHQSLVPPYGSADALVYVDL